MTSWVGVLRLQAIITGIVCASAVALAAPGSASRSADASEADRAAGREARGAEIARGIAFVLAPEWGVVYRNALRRIRDDLAEALRADGIGHESLRVSGGAIWLRVVESSALGHVKASIARVAEAAFLTAAPSMPGLAVHAAASGEFSVQLTGFGLAALQDGFLATARKTLERRLSGGGFGDYLLTDEGERIRVEIPPMAAPARAGRQC